MMLMFRRIWGDCQHRSGSRGVPAPGLPGRTQTHRRAGIAVDILQFKCQQFRKLKFYSIWSKLNDARSMSVGHQSLIARNNIQRSYTRTSSQFNDHGWGWNKCEGDAPHVVGVGRRGVEEVQWLFSILVKHRYNTSVAEHDRITLSCSPVPPTTGLLLCEKENIDKSELMAAPDTTAESPALYWTTIWMQLGRKTSRPGLVFVILWCRKLFNKLKQEKNLHPTSKPQYIWSYMDYYKRTRSEHFQFNGFENPLSAFI